MFREGLEAQGMRASLAMIITQRAQSGQGNEIASADLVGTVRRSGLRVYGVIELGYRHCPAQVESALQIHDKERCG